MAARLTSTDIRRFLAALGERVGAPTDLYLLGGGALCLLGSARFTQDLDYVGPDQATQSDDLAQVIHTLAAEMGIDVESVPIQQFTPVPAGAETRHRTVGMRPIYRTSSSSRGPVLLTWIVLPTWCVMPGS